MNPARLDYVRDLGATALWITPVFTNNGAYIEVVTGAYAASPLALKLHDSLRTLYNQ